MNDSLRYLTVEAVLAIHAEVLLAHGGGAGLRSRPLLESAVAAPQANMMGQLLISEPIEIAAVDLYYLCCNHLFVDGNKRVSLASCLVFLSENGLLPEEFLNAEAWEKLTLDVACGVLTRDAVTTRLRTLLQ